MKTVIFFVLLTIGSTGAWAAGRSIYSDLSDKACTKMDVAPREGGQEDYLQFECKGTGGYRLFWIEVDMRQTLTLQFGKKEMPLEFEQKVTLAQNAAGPKVEWRVGNDGKPYALIVRVRSAGEDPDKFSDETLVVAKVTPTSSCVVGKVNAKKHPNANEMARTIADTRAPKADCATFVPVE